MFQSADAYPRTTTSDIIPHAHETLSDAQRPNLKEFALASGHILGNYFFKLQHLHYGYWPNGLKVSIHNLALAQQAYCDLLIGSIPQGVRRILDVGAGAGGLTRQLLDRGYYVDCVSPSPFLTPRLRENVGATNRIFEQRFEQLNTLETYDLVLFAESLQYIPLSRVFKQSARLLSNNGYILISDFFRNTDDEASPIGGGHPFAEVPHAAEAWGLQVVRDEDITTQTAPTLDVANDIMLQAVRPIWEMAVATHRARYPRLSRFLLWCCRKRIEKFEHKHFRDGRTSESFCKFKTYRLLVLRNCVASGVDDTEGPCSEIARDRPLTTK